MTAQLVGLETKVTLHFSIELESGEVVDSTRNSQPATFVVGDGNLLEGFEKSLFGLKAGDQRRLRILPEQGFGQPNPNNVQRVAKESFKGMELEPGLVVSFADGAKGEMPGVVKAVRDDQVDVDFNHPLAGHTLYFDVDIVDVRAA